MKKLCLGLFPNMKIDKVQDSLPAILRECADDGIAVQLPPEWARAFGTDAWTGGTPAIDVAVSLGGDGTFLRMARCMVERIFRSSGSISAILVSWPKSMRIAPARPCRP